MAYTSFQQMRRNIINNEILRAMVLNWYDGSLEELFSREQRYMLGRLHHRAVAEIEYQLGRSLSRSAISRILKDGMIHMVF